MIKMSNIWARLLCSSALLACPAYAFAQASPYNTTSTGNFDASVSCAGAARLTRTINVPDSFIISDLDVGFLASHTWRGDIELQISHGGVTVDAITSDTTAAANADNYNLRLNDQSGTLIRTGTHGNNNDGLAAPPYQRDVRPNNPLTPFYGQNANGVWTLTMCDAFPNFDDGTFLRADLYFQSTSMADLSFGLTSSTLSPPEGSDITLTATVSNAGASSASGITAEVVLPAGLTFVSATGGATHSAGVVSWSVPGTLAASGSSSISITANVSQGTAQTASGEILTSSVGDPDSVPGNNSTAEDDDDTVTITPTLPTPPSLSCAAPITHDFDTISWTDGALTGSNTVSGETINFTVGGDTGFLQNDPDSGTATPRLSTYDTGGLSPAQLSLLQFANFDNSSREVTTTMNFNTTGDGVDEVRFTIFDVDFGAGQFEDRIVVTGSLSGSPVTPTLVRGAANAVSGNTALGDAAAANNTNGGNLYVYFPQPVDQVIVTYGSGTNVPADPGNQAIALHDVSVCERTYPNLSGEKDIAVWDPAGLGLYAIPGNDVIYTISLTNSGDGATDADTINLIDVMPPEIEFYNGDIDDGGPETDPVTFAQTGVSGLTFTYGTDVAYSNAGAPPANFAACSYTPAAGYDPNVTYICLNPKGQFLSGTPDPQVDFKFRARIK